MRFTNKLIFSLLHCRVNACNNRETTDTAPPYVPVRWPQWPDAWSRVRRQADGDAPSITEADVPVVVGRGGMSAPRASQPSDMD